MLSVQGVWVWFLVSKLSSHMPCLVPPPPPKLTTPRIKLYTWRKLIWCLLMPTYFNQEDSFCCPSWSAAVLWGVLGKLKTVLCQYWGNPLLLILFLNLNLNFWLQHNNSWRKFISNQIKKKNKLTEKLFLTEVELTQEISWYFENITSNILSVK